MRTLALAACLAATALAGEYAVLASGFRLRIEGHESMGSVIRLYTRDGAIDLPAAQVAALESEEPVATAAPAPAVVSTPQAPKPTTRDLVEQAALRNGLPPEFVHSVARVESAYRPHARSPKGAIGVMQLMPSTAAALAADPHDPEQNIEAGARHLRELLIRYNGDARSALAAYNAGAGAVARYRGVPPYRETQNYVEKVLSEYRRTAAKAGGR